MLVLNIMIRKKRYNPERGAHHLVPGRGGLPGVLGGPGRPEGLGTVELHTGANLKGWSVTTEFLGRHEISRLNSRPEWKVPE